MTSMKAISTRFKHKETVLITRAMAFFASLIFSYGANAQDTVNPASALTPAIASHPVGSVVRKNTFVDNPQVKVFIQHMVSQHQFKESELIAIFNSVKIRPKVIHHVKFPTELNPWYSYRTMYLTKDRISQGVKFWNKYQDALTKAEETFGVPASIIIATIGIESEYGKNTGQYPVIDALVNLAFGNTSRRAYFRQELEEFLVLTREEHLNPLKVMGSYAGAIGQPQFMPSSYRYYAVDFSDTGTIDLSHDEVDVIGSVANFYKLHGWQKGQPVAVPDMNNVGFFDRLFGRNKPAITFADLQRVGFVGDAQSIRQLPWARVELKGKNQNEYWMTFHNFYVIERYNPSDVYAMAVYQLSYYITQEHARS